MQLRLGAKFILIVVGILSVTLGFNAYFSLEVEESMLDEQLQERGRVLGHFISLISPESILSYDFLTLNEYAREVTQQRDVVYGAIVDTNGNPITSYLNAADPLVSPLLADGQRAKLSELLPRLAMIPSLIPMAFPISHDGHHLGHFVVGISRDALDDLVAEQLFIQSLIYAAIILFLSAAIYLVFRVNVLHPVQRLIRASKEVSDGAFPQVEVHSSDELGELTQAFNSMIRGLREEQAKLHHQANYDALTNLPNRMLAIERLSQELSVARREGQRVAVLFMDLDNFKVVNDTLGHAVGDQLLVEVGMRLRYRLREGDTIARLGGDEFLVLLPRVEHESEVERVTERLLEAVSKPLSLQGREVYVHCSIGIALFPDDGDCVETLMANADNAMYQAKAPGHLSISFFTPEMNARAQERLQLEQDLHLALDRNELQLSFQPILDAETHRHLGAEVLLRWNHPQKGSISPALFIPLAESTGQIVPIGEWVLRQSGKLMARWLAAGLDPGFLAVNISRVQFGDHLETVVAEVLNKYRLPLGSFKLEITEGVLLEDHDELAGRLNRLKAMGVKLALDDFGTGYSSLSYLKRFSFDVLKIDRSFVSGLPHDSDDASLVRAIVAMAQGLELQVVAEGVECCQQLDFLKQLGCDFAQGYLFSKPIDERAYREYLQSLSAVCETHRPEVSIKEVYTPLCQCQTGQ